MKTTVAIVDDHRLLAQALADFVNRSEDYTVLFCAENGQDLLRKLMHQTAPDIVLLDVGMPIMSGPETAIALRDQYPLIRVLALSMLDDEASVVQMMQHGARGYLLKGCQPAELLQALDDIRTKGIYNSAFLTGRLLSQLNRPVPASPKTTHRLNDRELTFIRLACSELTYVEIADKMCVSARTVDGYRESVFEKLQVRTRVGLVLAAIRLGLNK
ncbi:response regulator transcription factor [Fibrella sp. HMF5335]|uniref:Response regulator transcription factor n=1 Tax=Fibrella rubiginis TaxID=2817060 RepID=A0A939GBU3_9BACT|nr:response regulator transcription factor [Fibrella rubiginis]MBO0934918.1 response regulator transcription factor [Fibrella rubiginis]